MTETKQNSGDNGLFIKILLLDPLRADCYRRGGGGRGGSKMSQFRFSYSRSPILDREEKGEVGEGFLASWF